ncbi:hypothetical protein [Zestomonas carbonaria]|uniref:Uncharacterized protein n=1 Tax=Zestomonas carbonaria TaxID=2762745 RepID=A0A7U7I9Z1_9GAMM|nr:hypothetical protein [Pseudomonas carbonaria]CAD5108909.1 hypothetical protein PSEWESI4_03205 [Pseudomonas carbonaria]
MLRIRGIIGDWPVDLSVELEAEDWRQLAAHLPAAAPVSPSAPAPATPDDALWLNALGVLRQAGEMEGTALLAALEALAGGPAAGKRLLVRLRHHPQVQVESGEETPLYRWIG